jgi:hypothetical protein
MDTNRKEEGGKQNREEASCSFHASALKGGRKEDRHDSRTILPRRSFHRESGVAPPPSPTTSRPRPEKNHLSENLADGETGAEIFGDITRPESEIQSNLSRETRSQR